MRIEDIKEEFPTMPQSMRAMVEAEVRKQIKTVPVKKHFSMKRALVASLAATLALGTTVFAGVKLYQMQQEPVGKYGVTTKININNDEKTTGTETETENDTVVIPEVAMKASYLPEGMVKMEEGKYSYEATPYEGGISIVFYAMDMGDDAFEVLDTNVLSSEEIQVGTHDGTYLKMQNLGDEALAFNQRVYVSYPEYHYVMEMYIAEEITREEALKVAEGIVLSPVTKAKDEEVVSAYYWSAYLEALQEDEEMNASDESDFATMASADEMKNMHAIGDTFSVLPIYEDETPDLTVKVAKVEIFDDVNVLDPSYMDDDLKDVTDADNKLLPADIQYIKSGDGVNTVDEIVDTRQVAQKLVYVTLEYTNTSSEAAADVIYNANLLTIQKNDQTYQIYEGETPQAADNWDRTEDISGVLRGEMFYYDARGGERGNNYISSIAAGETKTVHVGFIAKEDDLKNMYLNLDTRGDCYEFSESMLKMGLVDIRQ